MVGREETADDEGILSEKEALGLSYAEAEEVLGNLECNKSGIPRATFLNFCQIFEGDAYLKDKLFFNALSGRVMVEKVFWDADAHPLRDTDVYEIRHFISAIYGIDNEKHIINAAMYAANKKVFNPVADRLKALKWDGIQRIADFFPRYLGADRKPLNTAITLMTFHGAIQRVFNPGCKFDNCTVLVDRRQGTGKSTIANLLALDDEFFTDELNNFSQLKEAYEIIRGRWIVELSEMLATNKTKEVEATKAYIARKVDTYREPYTKFAEQHPRCCIFIGTTNRIEFLPKDPSGNRRFYPVICHGERAERHPRRDIRETRKYIEQCYAEAIEIGEREGWYLELETKFQAELDAIREASSPENTDAGLIQAFLDDFPGNYVCTRLLWDRIFSDPLYKQQPKKFVLQDIADTMNTKITGWTRYKGARGDNENAKHKFQEYGSQRAWIRLKPGGGDYD